MDTWGMYTEEYTRPPRSKEDKAWQKQQMFRVEMARKIEAWYAATEHMKAVEGMELIRVWHNKWITELMSDEPAMFYAYLEDFVKLDVEYGHYEKVTGEFKYANVPAGFTVNDYHEWMNNGVLSYV